MKISFIGDIACRSLPIVIDSLMTLGKAFLCPLPRSDSDKMGNHSIGAIAGRVPNKSKKKKKKKKNTQPHQKSKKKKKKKKLSYQTIKWYNPYICRSLAMAWQEPLSSSQWAVLLTTTSRRSSGASPTTKIKYLMSATRISGCLNHSFINGEEVSNNCGGTLKQILELADIWTGFAYWFQYNCGVNIITYLQRRNNVNIITGIFEIPYNVTSCIWHRSNSMTL